MCMYLGAGRRVWKRCRAYVCRDGVFISFLEGMFVLLWEDSVTKSVVEVPAASPMNLAGFARTKACHLGKIVRPTSWVEGADTYYILVVWDRITGS